MIGKLIRERGFTLIELVVVIAIFGIVLAVAIPTFITFLPTMRLKGTAMDISAALQTSRMKAVSQNTNCEVVFNITDNSFTESCTTITTKLREGISFGVGTDVNKNVSGVPPAPTDFVTFSTPDDICRFSSRGTSEGGTIYLKNGQNQSYSVTVSTGGRIKIRKWDGTDWV
jgi:type IV fimbrial biogenesis protein FimT